MRAPPTLSVFDAAREAPARVAVRWPGGELTYAGLAARVARAAAHFAPRAAEGGFAPVALVAALRVESLVALFSLWELGLTALLVHPRLTPVERASLLEGGAASWLVDETWSDEGLAGPGGPTAPAAPREAGSPLAVVYTSGSSGRPKGVVLSRGAFEASARASAENLGWRDDDRWLLSMPAAHVGGLSVVTRCVLARRTIVLSPWGGADAGALCDIVSRERVTLLSLVPTVLYRLFEADASFRFPGHVRAVLLGGAPSPASLLREARERGAPVLTTYGMSEACSQIATQRYGTPPGEGQGVGRPLAGVEVRLRGGAIEVRGPTLMSGYLGGPDPFVEGGWFPTDDLGAFDGEGRLHVLGRRSDTIITGGENVSPREVEREIEAFPGVSQACVFGVEDERWGQLVAAAVAFRGEPPEPPALAGHLAARLAPHKRPRRLGLMGALPLLASGKVDKAALAREAPSWPDPRRAR